MTNQLLAKAVEAAAKEAAGLTRAQQDDLIAHCQEGLRNHDGAGEYRFRFSVQLTLTPRGDTVDVGAALSGSTRWRVEGDDVTVSTDWPDTPLGQTERTFEMQPEGPSDG